MNSRFTYNPQRKIQPVGVLELQSVAVYCEIDMKKNFTIVTAQLQEHQYIMN
jgi:hypothetical protein